MISDQILLGVAIGLLLYGATAVLAVGRRWTEPDGNRRDQLVDHERNVVVCPSCETHNELGYRYCRHCVDELPQSRNFWRHSATPRSRLIR